MPKTTKPATTNIYAELYPEREIISISELNHKIRKLIETSLGVIWVEGEISNLAQPSSGHLYFSLKDPHAQVRCAMFRGRNRTLNFAPEDGMQVIAMAKPSVYEPRGDYQLIVEYLEESGDGLLRRAFEILKKKLDNEGLFNPEHKKEIPTFPHCVGVITSATGAAIRDIISVCKRRFPALPLIIYPTSVQGEKAADEIVAAIKTANKHGACDVVLLSRGGGSLEDLWPFNEERVARAIYESSLPIISGVGHEIDFTIADFVADVRAPTPSAAAELVCPHAEDWLKQLAHSKRLLVQAMQTQLESFQNTITWLRRSLRHPQQPLEQQAQQLDHLELKLIQHFRHYCLNRTAIVRELFTRLITQNPQHTIEKHHLMLKTYQKQYRNALIARLSTYHEKLKYMTTQLNTLNPYATLDRGYAIVTKEKDGHIVRDSREVKSGERINTQLSQGHIISNVVKTEAK